MKGIHFIIAAICLLFVPLLPSKAYAANKILFIDSYHEEYIWSADITAGIKSVLNTRDDVVLKIFRMDTKRNQSEEFKQNAALEAKELIDTWQPDVVIASDDNASKYLIAPYFMNKELPFVFCGLNWDASTYGFPVDNVTGMIEVALFESIIEKLKLYADGNRIGYLASATISEQKEYENILKRFDVKLNARFVKTFSELQEAYLELQEETDMVLIQECRSVQGFDHKKMIAFVAENTKVPTGALQKYLIHYALLTFAKIGEEQGEHAARTALEIIDGASPEDIPIVANKKAKIYLNMRLAKKMGIKFPMELIENGHLISAEQKKLLFINSYHSGYQWSDDVEKGLLKALNIQENEDGSFNTSESDVKIEVFRMNTKMNYSEEFKKQAAREAKSLIESYRPDIVVTSDDNAVKYLVVPYFKNSRIPFVFCGVNWDASAYGLPAENVTGMVEITPALETLKLLKQYAQGPRIGYIGGGVLSEQKDLAHFTDKLGIEFTDGALVPDFATWKEKYLSLQESVDMLIWLSPASIKEWDDAQANSFILEHTKIPTGGIGDFNVKYALLGRVKIAEEQGWWAGKTALRILEGTSPSDIPLTTNKESKIFLNMELAKRLGIKFPLELIESATFVGKE